MQNTCALLEEPKASEILFLVIGLLEPLGGPKMLRQLRPASKSPWRLDVKVCELEVHWVYLVLMDGYGYFGKFWRYTVQAWLLRQSLVMPWKDCFSPHLHLASLLCM